MLRFELVRRKRTSSLPKRPCEEKGVCLPSPGWGTAAKGGGLPQNYLDPPVLVAERLSKGTKISIGLGDGLQLCCHKDSPLGERGHGHPRTVGAARTLKVIKTIFRNQVDSRMLDPAFSPELASTGTAGAAGGGLSTGTAGAPGGGPSTGHRLLPRVEQVGASPISRAKPPGCSVAPGMSFPPAPRGQRAARASPEDGFLPGRPENPSQEVRTRPRRAGLRTVG